MIQTLSTAGLFPAWPGIAGPVPDLTVNIARGDNGLLLWTFESPHLHPLWVKGTGNPRPFGQISPTTLAGILMGAQTVDEPVEREHRAFRTSWLTIPGMPPEGTRDFTSKSLAKRVSDWAKGKTNRAKPGQANLPGTAIKRPAPGLAGRERLALDEQVGPSILPRTPLESRIGEKPEDFARKLMNEVNVNEGKPDPFDLLKGIGSRIADHIPGEFWPIFHEVSRRLSGRDPTVLILSDEWSIPWELVPVEGAPEDGRPPFLAARAAVGRRVIGRGHKLPSAEAVDVSDVVAVAGIYTKDRRLQEAEEVDARMPGNQALTIDRERGEFTLARLAGREESESVGQLKQLIESRLKRTDLVDILIELDNETDFLRHFASQGTYETRLAPALHRRNVLAALIAIGCNIGPQRMAAASPGLSYRDISRVADWSFGEETLRAAVIDLVNYAAGLPLSRIYGSGETCSADGMRFYVPVHVLASDYSPLLQGRGVTLLAHTSDHYLRFYQQAIPCKLREATFTLDALIEHDTELDPKTCFTDTHGYTEVVMATAALLGFELAPRIRDIKDQTLYKMDRHQRYPHLDPILTGTIRPHLIQQAWDEVVRVIASMRTRVASPSLILHRLGSYARQNSIYQALAEIGRVYKTVWILRYLDDETLRRRTCRASSVSARKAGCTGVNSRISFTPSVAWPCCTTRSWPGTSSRLPCWSRGCARKIMSSLTLIWH